MKSRSDCKSFKLRGQTGAQCLSPKAMGFTLIELVMVILIMGILAVAGSHLFIFVTQNAFYLPNQVQTDAAASDALEIMVEGDGAANGLRFCKIVTGATATQVDVTDQDDETLRFRLDTGTGKLYRKVGAAAEAIIPYYMPSNMTFSGVSGSLFSYYDATDTPINSPVPAADVRRIRIDLIAQIGAGSFDRYEGRSQQSSSVKVNKYL